MFLEFSYWECKASITKNPDFCSKIPIEFKGLRDSCIVNAGGESILTEEDCKEEGIDDGHWSHERYPRKFDLPL